MVELENQEVSMRRRTFLALLPGAVGVAIPQTGEPARPKVPGTLILRARSRGQQVSERTLKWEVAQTAIIICDMWDTHTCNMSAQRVAAMAPRIDRKSTRLNSSHGYISY